MRRLLLAVAIGALVMSAGAARTSAQTNALNFFKNYFITGDYAVGGTSLWRKGVNGRATGQIRVNGVPAGVDVVAAFLYVQTAEAVQWSGIDYARFNGQDLGPGSDSLAKALNWAQATQPCWSVAWPGGRRLVTYRADVMRFLPLGTDNKYDFTQALNVEVPDFGYMFGDDDEAGVEGGGTGARAVGASLVVVYRDPTKPFRGVVIYDGGATKQAYSTMTQLVSGFYQAAALPNARMTHIVGDGRPYLSERVRVNGNLVATNPYAGTSGPKWDNPTFTNVPVLPGSASAAVEISPNGLFSDCVSPSAIVFSTEVQDTDGDGLLDVWESSTTPIIDPNGKALPNLRAMGADPGAQDIFVEVSATFTEDDPSPVIGPPSYGGIEKPVHTHLPSPGALKLVGDAFAAKAINVHFDMGPLYDPGVASSYVIGPALARGGDVINELATACTPGAADAPYVCQFSEYPGTVGWKAGFRFLRDEVLSVTPTPPVTVPPTPLDDYCDLPGYTCTRRFDANRDQTFRYALFAHAVGLPKSELACVDATGTPVADVNNVCAVGPNPDFHAPRTNTGVGDFPGADLMVTLGAFDDENGLPIGTPFMQASTLMHEMGHNFERRHGGEAFEPNCKPTYFSVMNYLYQLRGLLDDNGTPHLDFSDRSGLDLVESTLSETPIQGLFYRMGWYAPLAGSYLGGQAGVVPAARHCDGSPLLPNEQFVRIDARSKADNSDWNANGVTDGGLVQDINFNGQIDGGDGLRSSDDWASLRLNQIGSRRNVGGLYVYTRDIAGNPTSFAVGPLSGDVGKGDLGKGDLGKGDLGKGDLGKGDLGKGDLGKGDLGKGDLGKGDLGKGDLGKGDLGKGDLGKGDLGGGDLFLTGDPDKPVGELDFETATSLAKTPPTTFTAAVIDPSHDVKLDWSAPTVGGVDLYTAYRVPGAELLPGATWQEVGTLASSAALYTLIDSSNLTNGAQYTYFVVATYTDGTRSDPSNLVTISAVNDPPSAIDDSYATDEDTTLVVPTEGVPGVLANDTDDGETSLTAVLVAPPAHGTLALAADGSFTYVPAANYNGEDTFTYRATDGAIESIEPATVRITVRAVNDPPTANSQAVVTSEDTAQAIVLSATDVDLGALTYTVIAGPSHGALTGAAPHVTYTPAANYNGPDLFTFTVNDGAVDSNVATVSITVSPVNDAPTANSQEVVTNEDTAKAIALSATDLDAGALTYTVIASPSHGALTGATPNVTYTPAANYFGPDSFTFKVNDGAVDSNVATVSITVSPVNDAPTANADSYTMDQGTVLTIAAPGVLINDNDIDTATLTAVLVTAPVNGAFTLNPDGSFAYTPAATFSGPASFTYKVSDAATFSTVVTVSITVRAVGYGFVNVKNLPPAAGVTFKPSPYGTYVDLEWKFTSGGVVVASGDALPSITITGPGGYNRTFTPSNRGSDCTEFEYSASSKKWDFDWKPRNAAVGTYYVVVSSGKTGQRFPASGGFPIVFKK